ncbi:MAG: YdcF family protein [Coriobacteriales bacterium]|jgi:vancomycin permeability regulator SanA|nr:YdcF family protein [Coriobacteriales bacterium]
MSSGRRQSTNPFAWLLVTCARGLALFFASYSLLSLVAAALGNTYNQNVWWIDLSFMPFALRLILQFALIVSLYAFAIRIPRGLVLRIVEAVPSALFALFAFQNMGGVYGAALQGDIRLGFPLPFSLFIAIGFVLLAAAILFGASLVRRANRPSRLATAVAVALTVCVVGVLFPLGQMLCFGTTEYINKTDAAVVLGAHVFPNGTPSLTLQDRLDKAIQLYEQGRTQVLIMSGGIDSDGTNEAWAMYDYAVAHGVAEKDILVDEHGDNTQESAANTVEMIKSAGFESVSTISNFYHLARVKMLYLAEGLDVSTVPADDPKAGLPAPFTLFREIPGWWYYWFTNLA